MMTSLTGRRSRKPPAFTLIELLIVVILMSVIAVLALPNFSQTYRRVAARRCADDLLYTMRYAQSRAMTKHKVHRMQFDAGRAHYWVMQRTDDSGESSPVFERLATRWGRPVTIPADIKVNSQKLTVDFYPNGTIEKAVIDVVSTDRTWTVSSAEQRGEVQLIDSGSQEQ